jgi:capsular exopolysaccharide synthesis family protein
MIITDKQIKQILRRLTVSNGKVPGMAIIDIGGTVCFANPLWAMMHGYDTPDELIGKSIGIFHTEEQMEADIIPFMEKTRRIGKLIKNVKHIRRNGTVFDTQTKMVRVKDKQDNVIALVVFAAYTATDNSCNHHFIDRSIEPSTVMNGNLQQQPPEQKTNHQAEEVTADIKDKGKMQFADAKKDTNQAIAEQLPGAVEAAKQTDGDEAESKQVAAEAKSSAAETESNTKRQAAALLRHQTQQGLLETSAKDRSSEISLRDICYIFFRHKWKMASFFLAVMFVVAAVTSVCAKVYRSEAKLLMRLGHESVTLDPTAAIGHIIPVLQSRENEINSELEILKSQELIAKVVDSVGAQKLLKNADQELLDKDTDSGVFVKAKTALRTAKGKLKSLSERFGTVAPLSDHDIGILNVTKHLKVENLKDSSIISISYEARSPKLAQEVVGKLIDLHLEKHIAVHRTLGSLEFFAEQADNLRDKLTQTENELRKLKNETGTSSVPEQQRFVLSRIGTLKQEMDQTEAALASSLATVEALKQTLGELPKTIVMEETTGFPNFATDEMRKQLFARQLEELKLRTNFTEESGTVKAIHQEIAEAQSLLEAHEPNRTQVTRGLSKTYEQLQSAFLTEQANVFSLQAKIDAQKKQLAAAQADLNALNDAEAKITLLTREVNIQETNYRKYSENLEQARINHAMQNERISNISVVQAATFPIKAVRPNKMLNLALGLFLGILGAIVLALFSEHLDHSIKTPDEAEEKLQLPSLAFIPQVRFGRVFPTVKQQGHARSKHEAARKAPAMLEVPAKTKESYEAFREQLLVYSNGSMVKPYVLAVIGCQRHEGVSAVAANIAATISQHHQNDNVLLVDANLGHPSIHKVFNIKLSPGLTDVLANGKNGGAIQSLPGQNIHILSAGTANGNFSETFDSDKFANFLSTVKKHYRFVVVDVPPLSEASSAARLAGLCDGTVLVVAAERLRREAMQRTKMQLVESNANVLGVILNKRRFHIPGWLYSRL